MEDTFTENRKNLNDTRMLLTGRKIPLKNLAFFFLPDSFYTWRPWSPFTNLKYGRCSSIIHSPKTTYNLFDSIEKRAILLIGEPELAADLPTLYYRYKGSDLCLFYPKKLLISSDRGFSINPHPCHISKPSLSILCVRKVLFLGF